MKALECRSQIKNNTAHSYILAGDDESLKSFVKDYLISLVPQEERAFACSYININTSKDVNEIITTADAYVFGVNQKLVIVAPISYKLTKDDIKKLEKYFDLPAENTIILFEGVADNITALSKYCEVVECNKATQEELSIYISKILKAKEYTMNPYDIREFIKYCNFDFGKIRNELKKLMLYKIEEKSILKQDFEMLTAPDIELTVFNLTNELNRKNFQSAINTLNKLKSSNSSDRMSRVIFKALQKSYVRLFAIATAKVSDDVISSTLSLSLPAIGVNRRINSENKDKKYVFRLKAIVEYLAYLEGQFNMFYVTEDDALDLAINKIIETFS